MDLPIEMMRRLGIALVVLALILAMVDLSRKTREGRTWLFMAGSGVALLAGLGLFAPDSLLGLSYAVSLGGWLFYVVGIVAPVYFASRLLVIG
jgi:hypothetical protein